MTPFETINAATQLLVDGSGSGHDPAASSPSPRQSRTAVRRDHATLVRSIRGAGARVRTEGIPQQDLPRAERRHRCEGAARADAGVLRVLRLAYVRARPLAPGARRARPRDTRRSPPRARGLDKSLTTANIAAEVRYLKGRRPRLLRATVRAGVALQLHAELHEWATEQPGDADVQRWTETLAPLTSAAVSRIADWLPKLTAPIRNGEHSQTAFAFGLIPTGHARPARRSWRRCCCPARAILPEGSRVPAGLRAVRRRLLSPCVAEADLMRRVLSEAEFAPWLRDFLPSLPTDGRGDWLSPGVVTDPADPKLGHLYGHNLSRAWMLQAIARSLRRPIRAARRSWPPRGPCHRGYGRRNWEALRRWPLAEHVRRLPRIRPSLAGPARDGSTAGERTRAYAATLRRGTRRDRASHLVTRAIARATSSRCLLHRLPVGVEHLERALLLEDIGDLAGVADGDDLQLRRVPVLRRRRLRLRRASRR